MFWNVEVLGDERDPNTCVRLNNVEHHLGADVLQQILNVVADERVVIDGAPALPKNVQQQLSANQLYIKEACTHVRR